MPSTVIGSGPIGKDISAGIRYGILSCILSSIGAYFVENVLRKELPVILKPDTPSSTELLFTIYILLVVAPFLEEILFRFLPLTPFALFAGGPKGKFILTIAVLVSSAAFAYMHGSIWNIFVQGIGGIVFSKAYLRHGLPGCITAHTTHNSLVLILTLVYFLLGWV